MPRTVFEQVGQQVGQSFIVENRPGGGTTIGSAQVKAATESEHQLISIFDAARNMVSLPRVRRSAASGTLRYRDFLNAVGVAVYTTDAAGRITFFNGAAVELWGRRPELGEEWCGSLRLFHLDGRPMRHDECPMAIALKEHRPVRGEVAYAELTLDVRGTKVVVTPGSPAVLHPLDGHGPRIDGEPRNPVGTRRADGTVITATVPSGD